MDFKTIKTASLLGAFVLTILGSTALTSPVQANPYEGKDWQQGAGTSARPDGWTGTDRWNSDAPAIKRKRRVSQRPARTLRNHQASQHSAQPNEFRYGGYAGDFAAWRVDERRSARTARHARVALKDRAAMNQSAAVGGFGSDLVSEARRYIGGNPTGRSTLWCGAFMDMILRRTGRPAGSNLARDYANYGRRVSGPQVGAIAVMSRGKRGGHVGVVSAIDANGNPVIISGNHNRRVAEATYPRGRVYAYVMP